MIGTALGLEWRNLRRSPFRMSVLLLVLATGAFVIVQGQRDVGRWQDAVETGRAEQEESLEEVRGFFAAGRTGPEDRPWVDLSAARWQDWYAATRLVREPAPLAGIAFASAEIGAVAIRVNRFTDPLLAQGTRIENPALAAAGGLDLVAVLALLLPLLVLTLGVDVGSHERSSGILPLVRVQSGRDGTWIRARCIAVGLISAIAGLALTVAACVAGSADIGPSLTFGALVVAYVSVWTALLAAVALVAVHPSQGAVAMGAVWIGLCVLVPAIGVERSAALAADDFALDLTVEARDAGYALRESDEEAVFTAVLDRFPRLEDEVPADRSAATDVARDGLRIIALEERMALREERGRAQTELAALMNFASPAVGFTHALERLAGRGAEAARDYRHAAVAAAADRMERYIVHTWNAETLGVADFEALHAETPQAVTARASSASSELVALLVWTGLFIGLGALASRRWSRPAAATALELRGTGERPTAA